MMGRLKDAAADVRSAALEAFGKLDKSVQMPQVTKVLALLPGRGSDDGSGSESLAAAPSSADRQVGEGTILSFVALRMTDYVIAWRGGGHSSLCPFLAVPSRDCCCALDRCCVNVTRRAVACRDECTRYHMRHAMPLTALPPCHQGS